MKNGMKIEDNGSSFIGNLTSVLEETMSVMAGRGTRNN